MRGERGGGRACEVRGTSGQRERGPNAGWDAAHDLQAPRESLGTS